MGFPATAHMRLLLGEVNIWQGELVYGGLEKRRPCLNPHKICRVCRRLYWFYIKLYTDSVCTLVYQFAARGSGSPHFRSGPPELVSDRRPTDIGSIRELVAIPRSFSTSSAEGAPVKAVVPWRIPTSGYDNGIERTDPTKSFDDQPVVYLR